MAKDITAQDLLAAKGKSRLDKPQVEPRETTDTLSVDDVLSAMDGAESRHAKLFEPASKGRSVNTRTGQDITREVKPTPFEMTHPRVYERRAANIEERKKYFESLSTEQQAKYQEEQDINAMNPYERIVSSREGIRGTGPNALEVIKRKIPFGDFATTLLPDNRPEEAKRAQAQGERELQKKIDSTFTGQVLDLATDLPAMALEFMGTKRAGDVVFGGKAGAKAVEVAQKEAELAKQATAALTRAQVVKQAAKGAAGMAKTAAKQTAVKTPFTAKQTYDAAQEYNEDGTPISFLQRLTENSVGDFIENLTEAMGGEAASKIIGTIGKTALGPAMAKATANKLGEVAAKVAKATKADKIAALKTGLAKWASEKAAAAGLKPSEAFERTIKQLKEETAFNGMLGEWAEERYGEMLRMATEQATGLRMGDPAEMVTADFFGGLAETPEYLRKLLDPNASQEDITLARQVSIDRLAEAAQRTIVENLAFGIPGAVGKVAGALDSYGKNKKQVQQEKQVEQILEQLKQAEGQEDSGVVTKAGNADQTQEYAITPEDIEKGENVNGLKEATPDVKWTDEPMAPGMKTIARVPMGREQEQQAATAEKAEQDGQALQPQEQGQVATADHDGLRPAEQGQEEKPEEVKPKKKLGQKKPEIQVETNTGRKIPAPPQIRVTSNQAATKSLKEQHQWLLDQAVAEAESRGDDYAATVFRGEKVGKNGLPQASVDAANEYLFGETYPEWESATGKRIKKAELSSPPQVVPKATKPLVEKPESAQVPVMITQKMKADLRAKGVSEEQIRNMTPQQAHEELAKGAQEPTKAEAIPPKPAGEKGSLVSWTDAKGVVRHGVVTNKFGSDLSINDGTADSQRVPASKIRPYEGTAEFAKGDQVESWGKGADAVAKVIERNPDGSYELLGGSGRSFKAWPWGMKKVGEAKPSEDKREDKPKPVVELIAESPGSRKDRSKEILKAAPYPSGQRIKFEKDGEQLEGEVQDGSGKSWVGAVSVRMDDGSLKVVMAVDILTPPEGSGKQAPIKTPLDEFEEAGGQPWKVTRKQWTDIQRGHRRALGQSEESGTKHAPYSDYEEYHKEQVKQAIAAGKPVPDVVRKEYEAEQKTVESLADIGGMGKAIGDNYREALWTHAQNAANGKHTPLANGGVLEQALDMAARYKFIRTREEFNDVLSKLEAGESLSKENKKAHAAKVLNELAGKIAIKQPEAPKSSKDLSEEEIAANLQKKIEERQAKKKLGQKKEEPKAAEPDVDATLVRNVRAQLKQAESIGAPVAGIASEFAKWEAREIPFDALDLKDTLSAINLAIAQKTKADKAKANQKPEAKQTPAEKVAEMNAALKKQDPSNNELKHDPNYQDGYVDDLAKALGVEVIWADFGKNPKFQGFGGQMTDGRPYVMLDTQNTARDSRFWYLFGHELAHATGLDAKDLDEAAGWYADYLRRVGSTNTVYLKYLENLSEAGRKKEAMAHLVGAALTQPAVRQALALDKPGLFEKIVKAIRKFFNANADIMPAFAERALEEIEKLKAEKRIGQKKPEAGKPVSERGQFGLPGLEDAAQDAEERDRIAGIVDREIGQYVKPEVRQELRAFAIKIPAMARWLSEKVKLDDLAEELGYLVNDERPDPSEDDKADKTFPGSVEYGVIRAYDKVVADVVQRIKAEKAVEAALDKAPTKPKSLLDKAVDKAQSEFDDALDAFAKHVKGKAFSNPAADPEAVVLAAKVVAKGLKLGVVKFAKLLEVVYNKFGKDFTLQYGDVLAEGWDVAREEYPADGLDEAGSVTEIVAQLEGRKDGNETESGSDSQEPRVSDGAGEPGADATEVSSGSAPKRRPSERPGKKGDKLSGSDGEASDGATAGDGGRAEGEGAEGVADSDQSGLAGSKAADQGGKGVVESLPSELRNHVIESGDEIASGSERQSLEDNIAAIKLLKQLEAESREATPEEKKTLAKFTGWGRLSQAFDRYKYEAMESGKYYSRDEAWEKKWAKVYKQIRELFTDEEWEAARDTTINAHYTSRPVIEGMWDLVGQLGFSGGRVLEPGAGIGHFAGLMPQKYREHSKMVMVEMDDISSRLLKKLYPQADVHGLPLQDFRIAPGSVDLVIGNVPFAKDGPADAEKRYGQSLNLHNYFIARSLDAVKPGGLAVLISTHNTLDSAIEQRKFLEKKGDLVGAIRLPKDAFASNAGTEVVTDILVFRRPVNSERIGESFATTGEIEGKTDSGGKAKGHINKYFIDHPQMILGKNAFTGSMYRENEYTVESTPGDLAQKLSDAIDELPKNIAGDVRATGEIVEAGPEQGAAEGSLRMNGKKLQVATGGKWQDVGSRIEGYPAGLFKEAGIKRAKDFIALRDSYRAVRETMLREDATDEEVASAQRAMEKLYEAYIEKHGYLNENRTAIFQKDSEFYRVLSLENERSSYNPTTKKIEYTYSKAAVFNTRLLGPRKPPLSVATVKDALWVSLGYEGKVDIPYMARLVGKSQEDVIEELAKDGLAYKNPANQQFELRERYLSGNVKKKLREAEIAAQDDPAYQRNVDALLAAQPEPVGLGKVSFRLGSNWIPASIVTKFARQIFNTTRVAANYGKMQDSWEVVGDKDNVAVTNEWGVVDNDKYLTNGLQILEWALNLKSPKVMKDVEAGFDDRGNQKYVKILDEKATAAAKAITTRMQKAFRDMVNNDREVFALLEGIYNEKFNSHVDAKYDGTHLELPGSNPLIKLRPYQKNAIWRMLQDGYALLAHAVGAGKTYTMIGAAMEMRRLKLAKRPMLVVQNATLGQFAKSFMTMYPNAKVLVASPEDLQAKNRQLFLSKVTSEDWDAVVMAQSTFDRLASNPEVEQQFIKDMMAQLEEALRDAGHQEGKGKRGKGSRGMSPRVKDLVAARNRLQKRLTKILDNQKKNRERNTVTFEDLDIDAMFLDEAHAYKKPLFITKLDNLVGLNKQASERGISTMLKVRTVQARNQGRGVFFATGTPITNTLGEAWHMTNFIAPHINQEYGVETFDGFIGGFAIQDTTRDMNAGGHWVFKDALVKFTNGPELMHWLRSAWDILSPDDLRAYLSSDEQKSSPLPTLRGGKHEAVTIERTPKLTEWTEYMERAYARYKAMPPKLRRQYSYIPGVIYGAAKAAALDIRLIYPNEPEEKNNKLDAMVKVAMREYRDSMDRRGAQLIFSDIFNPRSMAALEAFMGTRAPHGPHADDTSVVDTSGGEEGGDEKGAFLFREIKKKLIAEGVPAEEIAFVADADTPEKAEALFERVKSGDVRFMLGSSAKMGVGVNVQNKLVAIHHLDAPWLPADVEQREGRIIRSGNENSEVTIARYAMKGTLDAAIFEKTIRKGKFIWQVMAGKLEGREFEDPASAMTLSQEEQLAAISGDPLLFERMDVDRRKRELDLEREAFYDAQARNRQYIQEYTREADSLEQNSIPVTTARMNAVRELAKTQKGVTIGKKTYDLDEKEQAEAAEKAFKELRESHSEKMHKLISDGKLKGYRPYSHDAMHNPEYLSIPIKIHGMDVYVSIGWYETLEDRKSVFKRDEEIAIVQPGEKLNLYSGNARTLRGLAEAVLEIPERIERNIEEQKAKAERRRKDVEELRKLIEDGWPNQEELNALAERLSQIDSQIVANSNANQAARKAEEDAREKARQDAEKELKEIFGEEAEGDGEEDEDDDGAVGSPARPMSAPMPLQAKQGTKERIDRVKLTNLVRKAMAAWGRDIPVRFGHISLARKALGLFFPKSEVVRSKTAYDLPTIAHEAGHAIEKLVYGWVSGGPWKGPMITPAMVKELKKLGRALYGNRKPHGGYKREGFAEFVRLWLESPTLAQSEAPEFYRWFEKSFLPLSAEGAKHLRKAQEGYRVYAEQGSVGRAEQGIADTNSLSSKLRTAIRNVRKTFSFAGIWEEFAPLREAVKGVEKTIGRKLATLANPYEIAAAFRSKHSAVVDYMARNGMIDPAGNETGGEPLIEIQKLIRSSETKSFMVYLWARRAKALWEDQNNGPRNPGLSLADADQVITELGNPRFSRAADIIYQWQDGVLEYAAECSPTLRQAVERIRANDPGSYIPLLREFEEFERVYDDHRGGNSEMGTIGQRLVGSGRRILNPIESLLSQAEQIVSGAHDRMVLDALINLKKYDSHGRYVEEVPKDQVAHAFDLEQAMAQVKKKMAANGIALKDQQGNPIDPQDFAGQMLTLFAPAKNPNSAEPIIPYYDAVSDSVKWYYVNKDIYESLRQDSAFTVRSQPAMLLDFFIGKPMRGTVWSLRAGATGLNVAFNLITNPLRDTKTLLKNTQASRSPLRAMVAALTSLPISAVNAVTGGHVATKEMHTFDRLGIKMAQGLRQDGIGVRRLGKSFFHGRVRRMLSANDWLSYITDVLQFSDSALRAAEIKLVAQQNGIDLAAPLSLADSIKLTLAAKQITTDFSATGSVTRALSPYIPFFRAAVQGPRSAARAAMRDPIAYTAKLAATSAILLFMWWRHKDEEWWKNLSALDKLRATHIPVTINGRKELMQIPHNQDADYIAAGLVASVEAGYHGNPAAIYDWMRELAKNVNPLSMPPLLQETVDQLRNRDHYFDTPVVPEEIEKRAASQEFNEYTSELAKVFGRITEDTPFEVSPMRIDHAIRGLGGGVAADVAERLGFLLTGRSKADLRETEPSDWPVIGRLFVRGGPLTNRPAIVKSFYELHAKAEEKKNDVIHPETEQEKARRLVLDDARKAMSSLSAMRQGTYFTDKRRDLQRQSMQLAEAAIKMARDGSENRIPMAAARKAYEFLEKRQAGDFEKAGKLIKSLRESAQMKAPKWDPAKEIWPEYQARKAAWENEAGSAVFALQIIGAKIAEEEASDAGEMAQK